MKKLFCLLFAIVFIGSLTAADKPNILIIFCDDLGYGDTGFNGSKDIYTPHLDKLAHNGVIVKNGSALE